MKQVMCINQAYTATDPEPEMKVITWNCQGIGNPRVVISLKLLNRQHRPYILFLYETKLKDAEMICIKKMLGFGNCFNVNCEGKSGGLSLL